MIKYSADYIARLNEKTYCWSCGKEMRLGQRAVGYKECVCALVARGLAIRSLRGRKLVLESGGNT